MTRSAAGTAAEPGSPAPAARRLSPGRLCRARDADHRPADATLCNTLQPMQHGRAAPAPVRPAPVARRNWSDGSGPPVQHRATPCNQCNTPLRRRASTRNARTGLRRRPDGHPRCNTVHPIQHGGHRPPPNRPPAAPPCNTLHPVQPGAARRRGRPGGPRALQTPLPPLMIGTLSYFAGGCHPVRPRAARPPRLGDDTDQPG